METQYEDREYVFKGGMIRHVSLAKACNAGFWTAKSMHGDEEEALTRVNGSELFSPADLGGRIEGLFQVTLNAVLYYFAMANGKIYRVFGSGLTDLLTGQVAGYYEGRTLNSIFYLTSGVNANRKILSNLFVQNVGIAAPATPLTAAVSASAGVLNAAYSYKYTYRNSITGHESDPSPVSNTVSPTNDQVDLSLIANSPDTQVDRKVIYRTTAGGAGVWFRVDEISGTVTTYADNIADAALGEEVFEDSGVPPQATFIEIYNGMMAYAGLATPNQNRVAMSGVLRPEAHDADNVYDLDPDEADSITGIKKFGTQLAVYKRKGLFLGSGRGPDEMDFSRTRVKNGSLGNAGIIDEDSRHFYLSERGPYVFGGLQEEFFGRPIQAFYKTLDLNFLANASGASYPPLNQLIWNVAEVGQADFNTWLIFNTQTKEWTIRDFASSRLSVYLDALGNTKLWLGGADGFLYTGDQGPGDNGANINLEVITRGICLRYKDKQPDLAQSYNFRHLEIYYDANGGTSPITVSYALDQPTNLYQSVVNKDTGASTFVPTTGNVARFDLNAHGRLLFVKLTGSSTEALVIRGLRIQGHALGRRA